MNEEQYIFEQKINPRFRVEGFNSKDANGEYVNNEMRLAWIAWQMARGL